MRKKVLLAEQSDAIRTIAESLLHQNGYDVINASDADKAKSLIITSQPNLLIVGADLKDSQGTYLYDALSENEATAGIPILFIADPDGRQIPYPDEVILPSARAGRRPMRRRSAKPTRFPAARSTMKFSTPRWGWTRSRWKTPKR